MRPIRNQTAPGRVITEKADEGGGREEGREEIADIGGRRGMGGRRATNGCLASEAITCSCSGKPPLFSCLAFSLFTFPPPFVPVHVPGKHCQQGSRETEKHQYEAQAEQQARRY